VRPLRASLTTVVVALAFHSAAAQEAGPPGTGLHVFLDCQGTHCDFDYFRTEIAWVNWVRDRQTAEVHLLPTGQDAGGGGGSYSRVRDQLGLRKESATDEEILLRLRELETSFRYFVSLGLTYTFGSIYSNVVNPRFGSGGF